MLFKDFTKLPKKTAMALAIASKVRNAMEDFHVKNLSDKQMKELNPIIRQAIYDCLTDMDAHNQQIKDKIKVEINEFMFSVATIPDYWEFPHEK
jgi:predicted DNA-binding protein YlxM (UPF0122 family)